MLLEEKVDKLIEESRVGKTLKKISNRAFDAFLIDAGFGGIASQYLSRELNIDYPIYLTEKARVFIHEEAHYHIASALGLKVEPTSLDADTFGSFGNYLAEIWSQKYQVVEGLLQDSGFLARANFFGEGLEKAIALGAPLIALPIIGFGLYNYGKKLSKQEGKEEKSFVTKSLGKVVMAYGVYNMMEPFFNVMSSFYAHAQEKAHLINTFATDFYQTSDLYKIAESFDAQLNFPELCAVGLATTGLIYSSLKWGPKLVKKIPELLKKESPLEQAEVYSS